MRSYLLLLRRSTSTLSGGVKYQLPAASWSISSLLPSESAEAREADEQTKITLTTLQHLYRLSALTPPAEADVGEQQKSLRSLQNHLHFVRAVQQVDTTGVAPLSRIEDEASPAQISIEDVFKESIKQKLRERERSPQGAIEWVPMTFPKRKVGDFYVVEGTEEEPPEEKVSQKPLVREVLGM
ncbi:hypothetical protein FN846DRAFT_904250 [Sphaerosporella brunnea]|uniref:Glutamyl-tRNA amidotransferase complex subunit Gta3 domain-containing protein n=1 Tax=Sphaerosporella brunnea TaxID=1250544 RepID=A0A5J5F5A4_9PEZI|nr:hypothetical protein FN846DRAFT_904250 [Sphaerosporella brunnea]